MRNAENKVGNGIQGRRDGDGREGAWNERTNYTTQNTKRSAARNSSRHFDCDESAAISGSDKSIPPSPFLPLPYSLRAEFVSHTSRRQNSWGIPNNAADDDDDGAAPRTRCSCCRSSLTAKRRRSGRAGAMSGRIDDDAMTLLGVSRSLFSLCL